MSVTGRGGAVGVEAIDDGERAVRQPSNEEATMWWAREVRPLMVSIVLLVVASGSAVSADDPPTTAGPPVPWESRRGLETTDYNNSVILIRAAIDDVARAAAESTERWERDVLGRDIVLGKQGGAFVFRLHGHAWSILITEPYSPTEFSAIDAQALSRLLKTRVISYGVSDTMGSIGYQFYDNGELLEELAATEGDSGRPDADSTFSSRRRDLKTNEIANIWSFTNQFFLEQDAYEPGLGFTYFLGHRSYRPGDRVPIENPGIVSVMTDGRRLQNTPPIERVDYLALRAKPP
jgi:hypothetical protein